MRQLEYVKLIATRSTGLDHIPLELCRQRDIAICNVPAYGSETVAEHVFGLLLTISHNLGQAIDHTRKGDFSSEGLQGFDLRGKTLGVIGTGEIIETKELVRALAERRVSAARLDMFPEEPIIREEAELLRSVYEERVESTRPSPRFR